MSRLKILAIVAALGATVGCGNDSTTSPTTPTPTVTDTFSGAINPNGAESWSFTTAQSGNVTAALTGLGPDSTLVVGLALGTWNGTGCQVIIANDKATLGIPVTGTASSAGSLCVRIYDVGNVGNVGTATYEVNVVHY